MMLPRKLKPIRELDPLSEAERTQLWTDLNNGLSYDSALRLLGAEHFIVIRRHKLFTWWHREHDRRELNVRLPSGYRLDPAQFFDLLNGQSLPWGDLLQTRILQAAYLLAQDENHTPAQLQTLQRIANNPVVQQLAIRKEQRDCEKHALKIKSDSHRQKLAEERLTLSREAHQLRQRAQDYRESQATTKSARASEQKKPESTFRLWTAEEIETNQPKIEAIFQADPFLSQIGRPCETAPVPSAPEFSAPAPFSQLPPVQKSSNPNPSRPSDVQPLPPPSVQSAPSAVTPFFPGSPSAPESSAPAPFSQLPPVQKSSNPNLSRPSDAQPLPPPSVPSAPSAVTAFSASASAPEFSAPAPFSQLPPVQKSSNPNLWHPSDAEPLPPPSVPSASSAVTLFFPGSPSAPEFSAPASLSPLPPVEEISAPSSPLPPVQESSPPASPSARAKSYAVARWRAYTPRPPHVPHPGDDWHNYCPCGETLPCTAHPLLASEVHYYKPWAPEYIAALEREHIPIYTPTPGELKPPPRKRRRQPPTANRQPPTANRQPITDNR